MCERYKQYKVIGKTTSRGKTHRSSDLNVRSYHWGVILLRKHLTLWAMARKKRVVENINDCNSVDALEISTLVVNIPLRIHPLNTH